MFYPGTPLTDDCCNSNVEVVDNLSYYVRWYAPDVPSYVVLQICQGLGIGAIDPFFEVPPEEVVTWVQVRIEGCQPKEVGATRNESITRKIPTKEFQICLNNGVVLYLVVDNFVHIYSFPPQSRN